MSTNDSFSNHKLCGFLSTVLTSHHFNDAQFNDRCEIFNDGNTIAFRTQNGVVLSPIVDSVQCGSPNGKKKVGMVKGSFSVVHQLHALVVRKCLDIDARVLYVVEIEARVRVVVLVDVYLPVQVWSGWQFPKSGSVAGAVFRHLRLVWFHLICFSLCFDSPLRILKCRVIMLEKLFCVNVIAYNLLRLQICMAISCHVNEREI
jgi:hypothetical protein